MDVLTLLSGYHEHEGISVTSSSSSVNSRTVWRTFTKVYKRFQTTSTNLPLVNLQCLREICVNCVLRMQVLWQLF